MKSISKPRRFFTNSLSTVFILFIVLSFLHNNALAQAANNTCLTAQPLTVNTECSMTTGDLFNASTTAMITGACANSRRDVWYRFTMPSNSTNVTVNVTLNAPRTGWGNGNVTTEIFNARNCTTLTNLSIQGCSTIAQPKTYQNLMSDSVYYLRVTTAVNTSGAGNWTFNICLTSNDTVSRATTIIPGQSVASYLFGASADPSVPLGCATGNPDDDVWFTFTAVKDHAIITLNNFGSDLTSANAMLQLFSGAPGSLTSISCGRGIINQLSGITPGNTYYVRVYSSGTGQAGWTAGGYNSGFTISVTPSSTVYTGAGRMKEIYRQTTLSAFNILADPWEITYGPDNKLWITESKGYRLYRMDPVTGARDTVLDISQNSTFLPLSQRAEFNCQFNNGNGAQGGFAGMALHPKLLDPSDPHPFVYISYVYRNDGGSSPNGLLFTNKLVRFTYDPGTGKLGSPIAIDTLPGSNDHNSQRMIIAPIGAVNYLFYASGDMGAGQFSNRFRPNRSQDSSSVEGKILRYNLEPQSGESGGDEWVPNNNPYSASLGYESPVWVTGIRNNQGFAFDSTLNILYGSSHGPYSDDEINILQQGKNYGHPIVIGYAADSNYNGITAGTSFNDGATSSCPTITDETGVAAGIPNYKDPLFSAYGQTRAAINSIWNATPTPNNGGWPSEGWSGLDLYQHTLVPGWYKSLVASSLKWGRLVRIRVKAAGDSVRSIGATDTASYFGGRNRFRDLTITRGGKDIYVVMDRSATTSGPSAANPVIPTCGGCVQKYSFVGYEDAGGKSSLPDEIDISTGVANTCATGTTVTIDGDNSNYWVPITGPDGEIMAEIYANGQTLGEVTSSFYINTNAIRNLGPTRYLDRNITINPQFQPGSPVKVRFYITKAEFDRLDANTMSQISTLTDLKIYRNINVCQNNIQGATNLINPTFSDTFATSKGFVLQADNLSSLASFYFAAANATLPTNVLTFTGHYKNGSSHLKWETTSEENTDHFVLERSIANGRFESLGKIAATGGRNMRTKYTHIDENISSFGVPYVMYRLKMVDKDSSYAYSNVVTIHVPDIMITSVNLFPNPANNETIISITSPRDQAVNWQLIDNAGRTILSNTVQARQGNHRITLDLSKIPAGSYFIQISGQFVNTVKKLQKL